MVPENFTLSKKCFSDAETSEKHYNREILVKISNLKK